MATGYGGKLSPTSPSNTGWPRGPSPGTGNFPKAGKGVGKQGKGLHPHAVSQQPVVRYELGTEDPPPYGDLRYSTTYWDARHAAVGDLPFDWYMGYDRLAGILKERLPAASSNAEILEIGFGTSELPARLHADGWVNITAIDTSVVAVTRARSARRHNDRKELQFLQMDACKMEFPDECFNAVIDKALLDTLVTGGHAFPRVRDMLSEVYRILTPGGMFFCISHAGPSTRLPYLAHDSAKPWKIEVAYLEKDSSAKPQDDGPDDAGGGYFHVYICTKPPLDAEDPGESGDDVDGEGLISPEMVATSELVSGTKEQNLGQVGDQLEDPEAEDYDAEQSPLGALGGIDDSF